MADDLQAVIGQLFVVGGRAVRTPPPGALAEAAPKRAPRAREEDTFCVLVTPAGEPRVPATVFEGLAQFGADVYFGSGGGITGGLREALTAIHQQTRDQQPVNALAVGIRGSELYIARSGKTFGVLYRGDQPPGEELAFFPADRRDPLVMNMPPLGILTEPEIQLGRYTAAPDAVMLLADEHLIAKGDETWRFVLGCGDVDRVIDALRGVAGLEVAACVIRFLAPGVSDPGGALPQPGTRAPRTVELRDDRSTAPPKPHSAPEMAAPERTVPAEASETRAPPVRPSPVPEPHIAESGAPGSPLPFTLDDEPAPAVGDSAPFVPGTVPHDIEPEGEQSELTGDQPRWWRPLFRRREGMETFEERTDEAIPAESPPRKRKRRGPSSLVRIGARIKKAGRDIVRTVLAGVLGVITFFSTLLESILPAPDDEGKSGIPTNVAVGLAILIPLVIVIVVVGLALSEQGKTDYEVVLERAQAKHQEALALSGTSCENPALRPVWIEVLNLAQQAARFRPNDTSVLVIEADARNYLDCYDGVDRRNLGLLHTFEADADLVGPIVNGGVDLFVLDRATDAVYHDTLNVAGDGLTSRSDDPILWRGYTASDGQYVVQDLIDIEWLASGGTVHDNVLIALDRSGALWAYSPTFFTTVQQLITSGWVNPVAIAVFDQWLYVLDTGANQVWRYMPPAGENAYSAAPEEYFNGEEIPDLGQAVDMGISSDEGAVYILYRDGIVKKFRRNIQGYVEEQPFFYKEQPPGALASGTALFVDNDPASVSLYIVDQENATIYRTSFSGRYNRGIRPQNLPDAFDAVTGIYADAVVRNDMYVVAGNKLYYFPREQ
jgi:hypothetical protein